MRWNVKRDSGRLGTENVWSPCNIDKMIRYQDVLTKNILSPVNPHVFAILGLEKILLFCDIIYLIFSMTTFIA